jgi:hypothetical protein
MDLMIFVHMILGSFSIILNVEYFKENPVFFQKNRVFLCFFVIYMKKTHVFDFHILDCIFVLNLKKTCQTQQDSRFHQAYFFFFYK